MVGGRGGGGEESHLGVERERNRSRYSGDAVESLGPHPPGSFIGRRGEVGVASIP